MVLSAIKNRNGYSTLPASLKKAVSNALWRECVRYEGWRQLEKWTEDWAGHREGGAIEELKYYEGLLKDQLRRLALYPHHFADIVVGALRVTPYTYYCDMLVEVLRTERAYDCMPNWTAADCNRVLGIGRNEFIKIINQCRAKGWLWNKRKGMIRGFLPSAPMAHDIEGWWVARTNKRSADEWAQAFKGLGHAEAMALGMLKQRPAGCTVEELGVSAVRSLYEAGIVWLDVPISPEDRCKIPPLHNFVMNKDCGDDGFEQLLYEILVSHDERANVKDLAAVLGCSVQSVQTAVSLYCRLGFAERKKELATNIEDDEAEGTKRLGILFDSQVPAVLMMGNLSASLKAHAVTLFEAGKLPDEAMGNFLEEVKQVDDDEETAALMLEAGDNSYVYAHVLRQTLEMLRHNQSCIPEGTDGGVDLLRVDSLNNLGQERKQRVLEHKYVLLMSLVPFAPDASTIACNRPPHLGPMTPLIHSPWFRLWLYQRCGKGPMTYLFPKGTCFRQLPAGLAEYRNVMSEPWSKVAQLVSGDVLLPHLEETLVDMPLLIQAVEGSWETRDVAFPILEGSLQGFGESEAQVRELLLELQEVIDLSCICGFVRLLRSGNVWVPQDLVIGIPAHDAKVNAAVLRAITEKQLTSATSMALMEKVSEKLCAEVSAFVAQMQQGSDNDHSTLTEEMLVWDAGEDPQTVPPHPGFVVRFDGHAIFTGGM